MKEDKEVPKLENWVTLPEAARLLNVSNQMVHKMVFELKFFKTVRTVGDKPVYVLPTQDVITLALKRQADKTASKALIESV